MLVGSLSQVDQRKYKGYVQEKGGVNVDRKSVGRGEEDVGRQILRRVGSLSELEIERRQLDRNVMKENRVRRNDIRPYLDVYERKYIGDDS